MERLTEKNRNSDGTGISKKSLVVEYGMRQGLPSNYCSAIVSKLAEYEDLEEQGLLLKLTCFIGSDVYFIPSKVNFELNKINGHEESNRVYHQKVAKIVFTERGWYLESDKDLEYGTGHILVDKLYKETWFLTQAEAEDALQKMKETGI